MQVTKGNYSDAELRSLDRKLLHLVATYNGIAVKSSPALLALLAKKKVLPADSLAANRIMNSFDYRTTVHVRPESYLNTHGGNSEFNPTVVTHKNLSGKTIQRDNLPLPLPFSVERKYDNLIEVAALSAQVVKNDQGVWVSSVNTVSWQKVYAQGVNAAGMQMVASKVSDLLSQSELWKAMTPIQHNAVQGPEMLAFVTTILNGLSEYDFLELSTIIVLYGLQAMEQRGERWVVLKDDKNQPLIPSSVWEPVKPTEKTKGLLQYYPAILKYKGGVPIVVQFPEQVGTFKNALMAQSLLREVQGSDNSCISLLSAMRGYSGMTDDFGRKVQFIVSAILYCWSIGRRVTVQLETVGDLSILVSSANYWRRKIELALGSGADDFAFDRTMQFSVETCVVKFMLPGVSDTKKVVGSLQTAIVGKPVQGSVVVMYDPGTMPTSESKGKPVDFDYYSRRLFPSFCEKNDFLFYSIVFGDYPFPMDKEVLRDRHAMTSSFNPLKVTRLVDGHEQTVTRNVFVYRHGTASGFRGILSSLEVSLVGYGHTPIYGAKSETTASVKAVTSSQVAVEKVITVPTGYDMTRRTLHRIPLELVKTRSVWYDRVILDCKAQSVIFGNPVIRYSGISNLVYQSKAAAVLNLSLVPLEDGVSSGLIAIRKAGVVVDEEVDFTPRETTAQMTTASSQAMAEVEPRAISFPIPTSVQQEEEAVGLDNFFNVDTLSDDVPSNSSASQPNADDL